jgi:hypothetical protein
MSALRAILEAAQAEARCSAADLTVLSTPVHPYRLDTPTGHAEVDAINDQLRSATDTLGIALPLPEAPEPELPEGVKGLPIIDSAWSWVEQTKALKRRKSYGNGGEA